MSAAQAINYCRVEEPMYSMGRVEPIGYTTTTTNITIDGETSISAVNLQDALTSITTALEYRTNPDGELRPYYGDQELMYADSISVSNSADITINDGTSSYKLTDTVNELKDEIQFLKDEINNLKMLLLEN